MQLRQHLKKLFDYDHWATARLLDCLRQMDSPPAEAASQLAHCLSARQAWLMRLTEGESFAIDLWRDPAPGQEGIAELAGILEITQRQFKQLLEERGEDGLMDTISYQSYERTFEQRSLHDILVHLVNHSSYHRGLAVAAIRSAGESPVGTDYIEFAAGNP